VVSSDEVYPPVVESKTSLEGSEVSSGGVVSYNPELNTRLSEVSSSLLASFSVVIADESLEVIRS